MVKFQIWHFNSKFSVIEGDASEDMVRMLKMKAPIICYTAIDDNTLKLDLELDDKHIFSHVFKLGEEEEMEKRDGSKIKMKYTLEGDNILKQVTRMPDGKTAYFTREFKESEIKMSVTMEGSDEFENTVKKMLIQRAYYTVEDYSDDKNAWI